MRVPLYAKDAADVPPEVPVQGLLRQVGRRGPMLARVEARSAAKARKAAHQQGNVPGTPWLLPRPVGCAASGGVSCAK